MRDVENILFDFNGTIVNDLDLCLELLNNMLKKCHHPTIEIDKYLEIFDFPVIEYYKKAGFVFPQDDFPKLADYFIEEYEKRNNECSLIDGIVDVFEYLRSKGKKIYIVSASEIGMLTQQLKRYSIEKYFDGISGLNNIYASSKIESAKRFMEETNINPHKTIFIGDTLHDLEVANELNVECFLVAQGHQSEKRLRESGAQVLKNIKELKKFIV